MVCHSDFQEGVGVDEGGLHAGLNAALIKVCRRFERVAKTAASGNLAPLTSFVMRELERQK